MRKPHVFLSAVFFTLVLGATASAATITSTAVGGNWSANATWVGGVVPGATDDVVIADGATVTIDVTTTCASLQVGQGSAGILQYQSTPAVTLTVTNDVTIMTRGTFQSAATLAVTHGLSTGGNLTNNGTLDFSTNANTASATITFTGSASKTFSGNGPTTDIRAITVNKGSSSASILELSTSNFTVQGVTTNVGGFLTLTNGTFKISGSFTGTNRVFTTLSYTIGATTGFWLNNSNYTIAGQGGSLTLDGSLRISSGVYNIGTATGNVLRYNSGSSFTMDGGTLNVSGSFQGDAAGDTITFNMSAGTLTVRTQGANAISDVAGFDIRATGSSFTMSGGTIVIQDENTAVAADAVDYRNQASTVSITGGTVQFGNSATGAAKTFVVAQSTGSNNVFPSLAIDPTQAHTVTLNQPITVRGNVTIGTGTTLNANSLAISVTGNTSPGTAPGNWTNNGTFTPGTQTTTFNGTTNQTIGGSAATTFSTLTIANTGSGNEVVSLAANTIVGTALVINDGVFDQGASSNLTTNTVTVAAGATWRNLGTGDVALSGDVTNSGTIRISSSGSPCGNVIAIDITSTGTQRSWTSGVGTPSYEISDVTVQDQGGTALIVVQNGTSVSGNGPNWTFVPCASGTYTWNGGLLGDWQIAANWTPSRTLPAPNDILIIGGGFAPIINNVPTQEIAALRITGGTSVTLTTSAANTLTISGQTGTDLEIPSSNFLTLADINPLKINVRSGSTATIGGQIIFEDSGHRLIGNASSAALFHSGADFTTEAGFTGNAFGTGGAGDGTLNSVQFENGSQYFHNAGDSPFGTIGQGPVIVFQTGSEADWLTNTGFQASGRTYATLVVGNATTAVSVSDSGTGDFKFDNLAINSTSTTSSTLTFTGSGSSTITIQGNITSNNTGSGSLQDITLTAGSGGIQINKPGGGTIGFGNFGNTRALLLGSDTNLDSGTILNLGRVVLMGLGADRIVTANGTLVPNFIAAGYIVGAVRKPAVPNGSFTFPVGTVLGYTPVALANSTGGGDLTVRAVAGNHSLTPDPTSLDEYWKLTLNVGSLTTDLTFNYLQANVDGTETNYRVIRISGTTIVNFPATVLDDTNNTATVTGISGFSDWTLGEPVGTTAVRLTRFNATSFSDGVQLNWESGFEVNNLGYHVYRELNGERTRVTPSVVAGSALTVGPGSRLTAGYSYSWFDPEGTPNASYSLEAIDLDGSSEFAGPIYSAAGPIRDKRSRVPAPERAMLLNEIGADTDQRTSGLSSWPAAMKNERTTKAGLADDMTAASADALATQRTIAAGKAVKIHIRKSGWYRVTQAELLAAGFDTSSDARMLQLYVDGNQVPISLSTDGPRLGPNDTLEFYGVPLDTPTTDTQVYWLISGTSAGQRIISRRSKLKPANQLSEPVPGSFDLTVERKDKLLYFSSLLNGDAENIFGAPVRVNPINQTLPVRNLDVESVSQPYLEVALQGLTAGGHQVQVKVNGTSVGTLTFAARQHPVATFPVNPALLREGDNIVSLASMNGTSDISLTDRLRLTYPHQYKADSDILLFSVLGGEALRINGFTSPHVRVIDVTNPNLPTQLSAIANHSGNSYSVRVQPTGSGTRTLLAMTDDLMAHPVAITANQPSDWNAATNGADMVIITHNEFRQAIEPLANLRRNQGLSVAVVDVEDLYDEFSYGAHTPFAIKSFLMAAANWTRKPAYLLLVGDSSWDPRRYLNGSENDFVPTKLIDTQAMETGSDDWFADFSDAGLANMAIGRLPAGTAAEASLMVSKIMTYEQERALNAPPRGAVMVADRGFEEQSNQTFALLPFNIAVKTINRAEVGNDDIMRGQIVDALTQGPMIVNYYGHGSVSVWTGNGLLNSDLATNLTNNNRLSLFVMMTCLNGYASDANIDSLGEATLKAPNGGAVAVWASSGFTAPEPQFEMNREFYRLLFRGQPIRLGDAIRGAKAATSDMDVRRTWVLLGDPAMRIR